MKILTAALLASAFIASPALACGFGKSAEYKMPTHSAAVTSKPEEAMSTFDPKEPLVFEEEATAAPVEETVDEVPAE